MTTRARSLTEGRGNPAREPADLKRWGCGRESCEWPTATFWLALLVYGFVNLCAWIGASGRL
ncbi:MAG: hypothetical protein WC718_15410 [Phycisphaerales bacterium]|jgi:hypothetical protein